MTTATDYPAALIAEESARIIDGRLTWAQYRKASRSGSAFRISRKDRRAIYDIALTALCGTVQGRAQALEIIGCERTASTTAWVADDSTTEPRASVGSFDYEGAILDEAELRYHPELATR
jgi:hypothetical protein